MSYLPNQDYWLQHAIDVIKGNYGDVVSVDDKMKDLVKFGRSVAVGTSKTTLEISPSNANEIYSTTNNIDRISSSNTADTFAITVEGHTVDASGNFSFVSQPVTLNGHTAVVLNTPLARATRIYNHNTGTPPANGTALQGDIYVFEAAGTANGVPTDLTKVHLQVQTGQQNSEKASTTVSQGDYWIVTGVYGDVLKKTAAYADIHFEVRMKSGVFREWFTFSASNSSGGSFRSSHPYIIVPPNADVRLTAHADSASTEVSGGIFGALASIVT